MLVERKKKLSESPINVEEEILSAELLHSDSEETSLLSEYTDQYCQPIAGGTDRLEKIQQGDCTEVCCFFCATRHALDFGRSMIQLNFDPCMASYKKKIAVMTMYSIHCFTETWLRGQTRKFLVLFFVLVFFPTHTTSLSNLNT